MLDTHCIEEVMCWILITEKTSCAGYSLHRISYVLDTDSTEEVVLDAHYIGDIT